MERNSPAVQGPQSNFEIGGGGGEVGTVCDSILGRRGTKHFLVLTLYNFKNIGGHVPPGPPYSAVPVHFYSGAGHLLV